MSFFSEWGAHAPRKTVKIDNLFAELNVRLDQ